MHKHAKIYPVKILAAGHIILRGWCESSNTTTSSEKFPLGQRESQPALRTKSKQNSTHHSNRSFKKENRITLWFEIDDTGCGMYLITFQTRNSRSGMNQELLSINESTLILWQYRN